MKVGGFAASLDKTIQPGFARGKQANRPAGEETIQPRLWREEMHPPFGAVHHLFPGGGELIPPLNNERLKLALSEA
jgi:hypothetical protein